MREVELEEEEEVEMERPRSCRPEEEEQEEAVFDDLLEPVSGRTGGENARGGLPLGPPPPQAFGAPRGGEALTAPGSSSGRQSGGANRGHLD